MRKTLAFYSLCTLILTAVLMTGCSWNKKEKNSDGPLRVQIPFAINGQYSLQIVDLLTIQDLTQLRGTAARFLLDPDSVSGQLRGRSPQLRYMRNRDGIVIAKDDLSLQLLTVYAHYERLQMLDQEVGAQGLLTYPRTVAVDAQYKAGSAQLENNALYSGQYDSLLLVPYTKDALPIMVNGGILGHEHFHALFQKLVIQPLGASYPEYNQPTAHDSKRMEKRMGLTQVEDSEKGSADDEKMATPEEQRTRYHAVLLRALNEGLADVWGWLSTGDMNFVGASLPEQSLNRSLDVHISHIESVQNIKNWIFLMRPSEQISSLPYPLGTQVARALHSLSLLMAKNRELSAKQSQFLLGQMILKALPELRKKYLSLKADEFLSLTDFLFLVQDQISDLRNDECQYLAELVAKEDRKDSMEQKCQALKP